MDLQLELQRFLSPKFVLFTSPCSVSDFRRLASLNQDSKKTNLSIEARQSLFAMLEPTIANFPENNINFHKMDRHFGVLVIYG